MLSHGLIKARLGVLKANTKEGIYTYNIAQHDHFVWAAAAYP
jgi:hypothetical protein